MKRTILALCTTLLTTGLIGCQTPQLPTLVAVTVDPSGDAGHLATQAELRVQVGAAELRFNSAGHIDPTGHRLTFDQRFEPKTIYLPTVAAYDFKLVGLSPTNSAVTYAERLAVTAGGNQKVELGLKAFLGDIELRGPAGNVVQPNESFTVNIRPTGQDRPLYEALNVQYGVVGGRLLPTDTPDATIVAGGPGQVAVSAIVTGWSAPGEKTTRSAILRLVSTTTPQADVTYDTAKLIPANKAARVTSAEQPDRLYLDVPAQALRQDTVIEIGRTTLAHGPTAQPGALDAYYFGPSGTTFDTPADLTMPYDEDEIPEGGRPEDLLVGVYSEGTGSWDIVAPTVSDGTRRTITVPVEHFSKAAIIAGGYSTTTDWTATLRPTVLGLPDPTWFKADMRGTIVLLNNPLPFYQVLTGAPPGWTRVYPGQYTVTARPVTIGNKRYVPTSATATQALNVSRNSPHQKYVMTFQYEEERTTVEGDFEAPQVLFPDTVGASVGHTTALVLRTSGNPDAVDLYEGVVRIGAAGKIAPDRWAINWTPNRAGPATLRAIATDAAGNEGRAVTTLNVQP